jgi:uncharacterized protein YxeA
MKSTAFIIVLIIALLLVIGLTYFIEKTSKITTITSYISTTHTNVYTEKLFITTTYTLATTYKPYMTAYFSPKGGCEEAIVSSFKIDMFKYC